MFACALIRQTWYLGASVLVAGLFFAGEAGALTAAKQTTAAGTNPNAASIQQLKATRKLMETADHDYQGHRAKAVHEVTKAIHALEGIKVRHVAHHPKSKGGNNIPQAVSDMNLRQAIKQLQAVQMQLDTNATANAATANVHITRAIGDLNTALSIK